MHIFRPDPNSSSTTFVFQKGMFDHGYERGHLSGDTEPSADDLAALEDNARAMAREHYRAAFDPDNNAHDSAQKRENERAQTLREEALVAESHACANRRDAENELARAQKAGTRPEISTLAMAAAIAVIAVSVVGTIHDRFFANLDDMLAWAIAAICAALLGTMIDLTIVHGRRSPLRWVGVSAGILVGIGLAVIRLSSTDGSDDEVYAIGASLLEIGAVVLIEHLTRAFTVRETNWLEIDRVETEKVAARDAAQREVDRKHQQVIDAEEIISKFNEMLQDRCERNLHIDELEALGVKSVHDGYNASIAENKGRIRGVQTKRAYA